MATNQTQSSKEAKVAEKPEFILTNSGVLIIGNELVGPKLAGLLCEAINVLSDSMVCCVVMRNDGFPIDTDGKELFGATYADTYSITLNLKRMWDSACGRAMKGDKNLGLLGLLMVNYLSAIGHELDHLTVAATDRELYETMRRDEEGQKDLENSAQAAESALIIQLARDVDTEIPKPAEMGWFGVKLMELFTNEDTKDLDWVKKEREMMEAGLIYHDVDNEIKCPSFRDFVQQSYDVNERGWDQPVAPVDINAHLENDEIVEIKAEELPQPEVKLAEAPQAAVAEVVAAPAGNNALFVGAGAGENDDGSYDGDDGDGAEELTEIIDTFTPEGQKTVVGTPEFVGAHAQPGDKVEVIEPTPAAGPQVELPKPVATNQAVFASGAASAAPSQPSMPTTYEPNNLDDATIQTTMKAVYQYLYHHIFTKCGWQQNPQTGRFYFATPLAILEAVDVSGVINQLGAHNLVMEYDTANNMGQFTTEKFSGKIRGHLSSKQGIPCYDIYLNINGQRIKRSMYPQNPDKTNAQNAYSNPAIEAQQGNMIAYVLKSEAPQGSTFMQKCSVIIRNNDYQVQVQS